MVVRHDGTYCVVCACACTSVRVMCTFECVCAARVPNLLCFAVDLCKQIIGPEGARAVMVSACNLNLHKPLRTRQTHTYTRAHAIPMLTLTHTNRKLFATIPQSELF